MSMKTRTSRVVGGAAIAATILGGSLLAAIPANAAEAPAASTAEQVSANELAEVTIDSAVVVVQGSTFTSIAVSGTGEPGGQMFLQLDDWNETSDYTVSDENGNWSYYLTLPSSWVKDTNTLKVSGIGHVFRDGEYISYNGYYNDRYNDAAPVNR